MAEIENSQYHRALARLYEMQEAGFPAGLALETAVNMVIVCGEIHEAHCPPTGFMEAMLHDLAEEAKAKAVADMIQETDKRYKEFKQSHKIK